VKIYEEEKIDNSIICPPELNKIEIEDPVELTCNCLTKAESIWNKIRDHPEEENGDTFKTELLSSTEYLDFLYNIKKLKFLKMEKYSKTQKLSIILNIYQTMFLHNNIKIVYPDDGSSQVGIYDSIKSLIKKTSTKVNEINYNISGKTMNLYEVKNIIIRRNRKHPASYLYYPASASDPRIKFIEEDDNPLTLLKLHIVCPDPPLTLNEEDYIEQKVVVFAENVKEALDDFCKMYVTDGVKRDENVLQVPRFCKDYVIDFGGTEQEMIKHLLKLSTDTSLKVSVIIKSLVSKELTINYY